MILFLSCVILRTSKNKQHTVSKKVIIFFGVVTRLVSATKNTLK